jgi:cellulose 1,4-beta-cellobiosidase
MKKFQSFSNVSFLFLILGGCLFPLTALGETINTCAPNQNVTVGAYVVQTDYWNRTKCPGTQCVNIDDQTGSFSVTQSTSACPDVSSYPSIVYGKAWGINSAQSDLPAPISSLQCVTSSWDFTPTKTGSWDAAYDIWVCPDNQCGDSGFNGGAEVMIWMDYQNAPGYRYDMGPVTLSGKAWELWQGDADSDGIHKWKYIAYLAKTPARAVNNLAIGDFLKDSISRDYIKPDWYLYAVEAGNEMRQDGVPFTSRSFSASVNKTPAVQTTYIDTTFGPTPTPGHFDDFVPSPP